MSTQVSPFFTPTQISGCSLWLDAADTTTLTRSGSNVSSWRDKSGNNNNATQPTLANQPTTGTLLNGLNVLDFTGTQPFFSFPTISFTNITVFTIFRNTTLRAYCSPLFIGPFFFFFTDGAGNNLYGTGRLGVNGEGIISQAAAGITTTNYLLYSLNLTVGATDIVNFYINGANAANFNGAASGGRSYYQVGSTDGVGATTGFTAEILVYNGVLNNSQRQQVEGYLAWKWGLQANLPTTHPYKNSPIAPLLNPPTTLPVVLQNPTFTPTQVSGCSLWYDAADLSRLTLSGSSVTNWTSKGTNAIAVTNSANYPTYVTNAYNKLGTLRFTFAINQSLSNASVANSVVQTNTNHTIFLVHNPNADNSTPFGFLDSIGTANKRISVHTPEGSSIMYDVGGRLAYSYPSQAAYLNGALKLETYTVSGGSRFYRRDGTQLATNGTISSSFDANQILYIGGAHPSYSGYQYGGDYCEIVWYNTNLTTPQIQLVEGYLAWKWGLQGLLPANNPYKSVNPSPSAQFPFLSIVRFATWQPNQISGLSLWLDAADPNGTGVLPSNGASLKIWVDKSGNTYNVSQNASLAVPVFRQSLATNGLPGLDFTGGGGLLSATSFAKSLNVTLLLVGMVRSTIGAWGTFWGHFPNGDHDFNAIQLRNTSGQTVINWHTNNNNSTSQLSYTLNSMVLYSCTMTNGNIMFMQQTNTSGTNSVTITNGAVTINTNTAPIWVGRSDSSEAINSYIYEIVYFQRVLSLAERQQTEGYLAWKWGLVSNLPNNHPYKKWPPSP